MRQDITHRYSKNIYCDNKQSDIIRPIKCYTLLEWNNITAFGLIQHDAIELCNDKYLFITISDIQHIMSRPILITGEKNIISIKKKLHSKIKLKY